MERYAGVIYGDDGMEARLNTHRVISGNLGNIEAIIGIVMSGETKKNSGRTKFVVFSYGTDSIGIGDNGVMAIGTTPWGKYQ